MNAAVPFEQRYRNELAALRALFTPEAVDRSLPRIREIHDYTEDSWHRYVDKLRAREVRYLLIAEAPPWSSEGTPQYMLDPRSRWTTFIQAVSGAFLLRSSSYPECLDMLAERGFLLLDSIPFAMDYSAKRGSRKYGELVRLTATGYLRSKIEASPLRWSDDTRIAFGVKRNARSILDANAHISLGGRERPLSMEMVAVSGAGYPDAAMMRATFGLGDHQPR